MAPHTSSAPAAAPTSLTAREFSGAAEKYFGTLMSQARVEFWAGAGATEHVVSEAAAAYRAVAPRWGLGEDFQQAALARDLMVRVQVTLASCAALTADQHRGWVTAVLGAPDFWSARVAWDLLPWSGLANSPHRKPLQAAWLALPGRAGPWGWAAGLRAAEAAGWTLSDMRTVAGLRGWALPEAAGGVQRG